jgi:hypothetical protein
MLSGRACAVVAMLALAGDGVAAQQPQGDVVLRTPGRGRPGVILQETLARPFAVIVPDTVVHLPRDSTIDRTVLVLGEDATVASIVHGDVIVVDGDLFLHPGAVIDGRAVAIGGGVYPSSLASVALGTESFRDATYDITRSSGDRIHLDWRVISPVTIETLTFPIIFGFRVPTYSRVDGLGVPWGPRIMLDTGRIVIDPLVTYQSDLGEVDPSLTARLAIGRLTSLEVRARRGTFSNDTWIQSDLANLVGTLATGHDYRNYWRADRAEVLAQRRWERASTTLGFELGARTERVRPRRYRGRNAAPESPGSARAHYIGPRRCALRLGATGGDLLERFTHRDSLRRPRRWALHAEHVRCACRLSHLSRSHVLLRGTRRPHVR